VLKVCTHMNITSGVCAGRPPQGGFVTSLQSFAPVDNRESIHLWMRTFCTVSRYCCLELFSFRNVHLSVILYHLPQRQLVTWCSVVIISELDGRGEVLIYNKWRLKNTMWAKSPQHKHACSWQIDAWVMILWVWTKFQHQDRYRVICCLLVQWHQPLTNTVPLSVDCSLCLQCFSKFNALYNAHLYAYFVWFVCTTRVQ